MGVKISSVEEETTPERPVKCTAVVKACSGKAVCRGKKSASQITASGGKQSLKS